MDSFDPSELQIKLLNPYIALEDQQTFYLFMREGKFPLYKDLYIEMQCNAKGIYRKII